MPQIANQDYIVLKADDSFDTGAEAFGRLWPVFEEKEKAGTLLDAVIVYDDGLFKQVSRVVGYQMDAGDLQLVHIVTEQGVVHIEKPTPGE